MKVLIIGGVAGGATVAARLRRLDETVNIILFERGEFISYANCGLPYYVGGTIPRREDLLVMRTDTFVNRFSLDVRTFSEVTAIDPKRKMVTVTNRINGKVYNELYDKLVITTGSDPIRPPLPGVDLDRIFTIRNIPDVDRIKSFISRNPVRSAVVVGGGFIGLEMVENLREAGLEVALIEKANQVMAPIDLPMARIVQKELKAHGVKVLLETGVANFRMLGDELAVTLDNNQEVRADLAILSIGVRPDAKLARDAGLAIGPLGGIKTDMYMQTSDPDIYALGDVVEVLNPVTGKPALFPLAGPANKQARIVADNIYEGNHTAYSGTIGTSIAKVFGLAVAATGASSKVLDREGIPHLTTMLQGKSHAGYYPGAQPLYIKINFAPEDGRLLGAQVIGAEGADKRIEMFSFIIKNGGSIYDLQEIEHAYAPPYSSAKDMVNMAGYVAENILKGRLKLISWDELQQLNKSEIMLLDVRTVDEYNAGHLPGAVNIPLENLRRSMANLPRNRKIVIYCAIGLRGYIAYRVLSQYGFSDLANLEGGHTFYD